MQALIARASIAELGRRGVDLSEKRVLEIGAGRGGYSAVLVESCAQLVVSDVVRHEALDASLQFVSLDATRRFPFPDEAFDFIYCSSVIEHLSRPTVLLPEARRVLRPGGRMMLSFPPFYSLFLVGGHEFKPWHLLGRRVAINMLNRRKGRAIADYADAGLHPLRISDVEALIERAGLVTLATWTRLLPVNTMRLPGMAADLATWHACWLLEDGH